MGADILPGHAGITNASRKRQGRRPERTTSNGTAATAAARFGANEHELGPTAGARFGANEHELGPTAAARDDADENQLSPTANGSSDNIRPQDPVGCPPVSVCLSIYLSPLGQARCGAMGRVSDV